ncbi:nol10 [Symbiodinium sp. CCMP2456]|nr:nol10 [Symbiodinium sp. CCMP2456]
MHWEVYNLSAGKSLPQWLAESKKKKQSLRSNEDFRKRIDLIQDFEFNVASSRVKVSPDGQYVLSTGIYAPELRIFDLKELGMKCSRGLDSEVVDLQLLSEDWKKLVMLLHDRTLEFHSQYGRHHRLRVPKCGRSITYDSESCTLFVGGSSQEVYRLDLEAGTFLTPIEMQRMSEVNEVVTHPRLPIVSCCGDGAVVESWDLRDQTSPLQTLKVDDASTSESIQVTRCAYSGNGMFFAAGTSEGIVRVYDLRSSRPLAQRDHMNDYAITSLCFHGCGPESSDLLVASSDKKSIKVWGATTGSMKASVESQSVVNDVSFYPNSGLMFVANDHQRIGLFFIPSIGLAPSWCSFLDNITEELEESKQKTVFEDFQFVTKDQLEQLGATELVGTKYLQPYMHGFFMDYRLHAKLKAALDPFAFEEYRKQKVKERLEAKRTMRTRIRNNKVDVNPSFHEQLQLTAEEGSGVGASKKRKEAADKAKRILQDQRFQALFADPDFTIEAPTSVNTCVVGVRESLIKSGVTTAFAPFAFAVAVYLDRWRADLLMGQASRNCPEYDAGVVNVTVRLRGSCPLRSSSREFERSTTACAENRHAGNDIHGVDDSGREYSSLSELWLLQGQQRDKFYKVNENWWVKGYEGRVSLEGTMIGDEASQEDVQHSQDFLRKALEGMLDDPCSALDCGAGIGRVTKAVLLPAVTGSVTLVDQSERWLQTAKKYLECEADRCHFIQCRLETYRPSSSFDVIWIQWTLQYLTDEDVVHLLQNLSAGLTSQGVIVLKENNMSQDSFSFHMDTPGKEGRFDMTRSPKHLHVLVELAGLRVTHMELWDECSCWVLRCVSEEVQELAPDGQDQGQ